MTTYEALKANETKRVRPVGTDGWWGQGALIDCINRGAYSLSAKEWEAEEPLIERWGIIYRDDCVTTCASESDAALYRDTYYPKARIVHLREVRS